MLSTTIIYRQTQFGLDQGLRFDRDQLLYIDLPPTIACEKSSFRTALENLPGVTGTACSVFFLDDYGNDLYRAPDGREVTLLQPGRRRGVRAARFEAGRRALLRARSRSRHGAAASPGD